MIHSFPLRVLLPTVLLAFSPLLAATTIDPFTVSQGPFTFGPGEEPTEEQSVVQTDSVLGGFRVAAAVVDEDAPAGSTATFQIGGGEWLCELNFTTTASDTGGGCANVYDRSVGNFFDLSAVTSFDFTVLEASGSVVVGVLLVDENENSVLAGLEQVPAGPLSIPRAMFFNPVPGTTFNWSNVDSIVLSVASINSADSRVRLGGISTTGDITVGDPGPPPDPEPEFTDEELSDTISGNFFNPVRDGEGCMLTREADRELFILTCYVYLDGEQVWMIGSGLLENGGLDFGDMVVTRGTGWGDDFDADAVERIPFGDVQMQFSDCNEALITMNPVVDGFVPVELPMERIVPVTCDGGVPSPENAVRAGNWYNPERSGEGVQLAPEGDGGLHILTFYTYLDGEPVWLIGTAVIDGQVIESGDVVVTRGTGFGPAFSAADVERIPFGKIVMEFDDCNTATFRTESVLPQFPDIESEMTRIVEGSCVLPTGDQAWEMTASSVTPAVTGDRVELINDSTIRLSGSTPAGWTVEFVGEQPFVSGGFYHSDDATNRMSATVSGPDQTCVVEAGVDDGKQAQMNYIMLADGVPQGIASVYGTCFDLPFPGLNLGIPFGSQP
jgi:hypothetical protein